MSKLIDKICRNCFVGCTNTSKCTAYKQAADAEAEIQKITESRDAWHNLQLETLKALGRETKLTQYLQNQVEAAKTIISEIEIASCCEGCRVLKDLEETAKVLNPCSSQENCLSLKYKKEETK